MDPALLRKWPRLLVVVVAAIAASAAAMWGSDAHPALFLAYAAMAGLVSGLVAPCRIGYSTLAGTFVVAMLVITIEAGVYPGLVWLAIAAQLVAATAGWLAGYALVRVGAIGARRATRDGRVVGSVAGGLAILASIAYLANEFASNPP